MPTLKTGADYGWLRWGRFVVHWKRNRPMFSERHGYIRYYRLWGNWRIRFFVAEGD